MPPTAAPVRSGARHRLRPRTAASRALRGMLLGLVWSWVWLATYSWPALLASVWVVIALTNPRRQPMFPGWAWLLFARDLWRDTRCDKVVVVGRPIAPVPTTQRSQA
jgi:hypothetical protein